MRKYFLCYSIIIMLNIVLINTCTCDSNDITKMPSPSYRNISTRVRSNKRKKLKGTDLTNSSKKYDVAQDITKNMKSEVIGDSTAQVNKKPRKLPKAKIPKTNRTKITSTKPCFASNKISTSVCNCSSLIKNFKVRKKETWMCDNSLVNSSQCICSSSITTQGSNYNSALNYVNSSYLQSRGQYLTQTKNKFRKQSDKEVKINDVTSKMKLKRKSSSVNIYNSTISNKCETSFEKSNTTMKSKSAKLSKNGKSSISRIKKTENNLTEENIDHKRKLLRQELIELMKNNSFKMKLLKKKTTKYPLIKQVTTTNVNYSQSNDFSVFSIFFLQNTTSSLNDIYTMSTRKCTSSKLIQTLNQNFLYSEESKVNFESSNESLLNHFDEIRVTPVDFVVENMGLQLSKEMFLYVPKNNSKKSLNVLPDSNTRKQRVTKSKSSNVRSLNITKTRRSNATKLRKLAKNTSTTKKLRRTTPFDLYNFFINDKLHQNYSIQKISTSKKKYNKMRTTKMSLQRQRKLNWKKFLLSAEEIDVTEVGPTVNIFSDIKEDYPVNSSEQMSNMVTLDMKTLPDTNEVIQFWNLTFPPWRNFSESNLQTSYEGCTMNSLEAMHFIRQNYSGLLTKKSCISHMSPFHPLLNPFVTKFDESILPNDNEAKVILSKLLNESIGKVEEKYFTTPVTDSVTVISPAKWRTEDNFDDLSLSYEWKVICGQARAMTTDRYKMTTELAISLPETSEAENILNEFEWPNLFKNFSERNREQSSTSDSHLPIATLSMKESKLILSRLGVELFGQQFRIDGNYRDEKSKPKMLHSVLKSKMHDKMLKNRKLEGYVFKMMTSTSPGSHEVYVPLEYEDSRAAFNVNFDMKLFLTKLCVYLSNWKHKNQTQGELASKKPGNSFLLGKPSYYKKRKNALI